MIQFGAVFVPWNTENNRLIEAKVLKGNKPYPASLISEALRKNARIDLYNGLEIVGVNRMGSLFVGRQSDQALLDTFTKKGYHCEIIPDDQITLPQDYESISKIRYRLKTRSKNQDLRAAMKTVLKHTFKND